MNILFASSEAAPLIKTGGLGDVAYALPYELSKQANTEVVIFLPYYKVIKENPKITATYLTNFTVPLAWRSEYCGLFLYKDPNSGLTYYLIDNEYYFLRDGLYGHYDDGERFAFYSKAILEALIHLDFKPDVIHCNDWQTALIPLLLKANFVQIPKYQNIKTVFTIHNIEYQGKMPDSFYRDILGLDHYWHDTMHYDNCLNFVKSAIVMADKVTTVSRTYAKEIQHAYFAHGLQHILKDYSHKVTGIVNGIDAELFNAQTNPHVEYPFAPGDLENKNKNKLALQKQLGLPQDADIPMIGMISRLVAHKGIDLVEYIAGELIELPMQLVVIGTGDHHFEELFARLDWENPDKVSANILFNPVLADQVYASADLFLMPSKSEPCGLSQMIAMRFGTIPIVRETGGLYDTVPALDEETMEGRGFTFQNYNAHEMLDAIKQGLAFYQNTDKRRQLMETLMTTDFSWKQSVKQYLDIYTAL